MSNFVNPTIIYSQERGERNTSINSHIKSKFRFGDSSVAWRAVPERACRLFWIVAKTSSNGGHKRDTERSFVKSLLSLIAISDHVEGERGGEWESFYFRSGTEFSDSFFYWDEPELRSLCCDISESYVPVFPRGRGVFVSKYVLDKNSQRRWKNTIIHWQGNVENLDGSKRGSTLILFARWMFISSQNIYTMCQP